MVNTISYIACINAGSSSIKLAVTPYADSQTAAMTAVEIDDVSDYRAALRIAFAEVAAELPEFSARQVVAVGHRIVHGGPQVQPARVIDDALLSEIGTYAAFDPEHTPAALAMIDAARRMMSDAAHIACFDTAFFHNLPRVAQLIALPRRYETLGLRRYGFHGLSYEYLLGELVRRCPGASEEKIVFAHLGSGASLAAVARMQPVDTTMGFTPSSGIIMSSRSGDVDPSLIGFLHKQAGLTINAWTHMVNQESGLLGVSDLSGDMYTLIQSEAENPAAREAVALFVYRVQKAIGEMTAAMGGVDRLVISGGIGEKSVVLRQRIVDGLEYLGFALDTTANDTTLDGELTISSASSKPIHVIHTNENLILARHVRQIMNAT